VTWLVALGAATGAVLLFSGLAARGDPFLARLTPYIGGPDGSASPSERIVERLARRPDLGRLALWAGLEGKEKDIVVERVVFALSGAILLAGLTFQNGILGASLGAGVGAVTGWMLRQRWLLHQIHVRNQRLRRDLPAALDLMSIAMIAGEGIVGALGRTTRHLSGPLAQEWNWMLGRIRAGSSVGDTLLELSTRCNESSVARFAEGLAIGLERGTPISRTLQEHAHDLREQERRELLETGGRREVLMLVPVVFLILPVIVLFVLYPGLVSIEMLVP
jgi:tight adherence protein C